MSFALRSTLMTSTTSVGASATATHGAARSLLAAFSLGVTWHDVRDLERARSVIPPGTRVHVGFVDSEDLAMRVAAVRAVRRFGYVPVPIIPARRMRSEEMLRAYLAGLRVAGASESVLVVGGDPAQPRGPYPDAASVIGSGVLEGYGIRRVSVAGHPGGHPVLADGVLWPALTGKSAAIAERGLGGSVTTQFGFDADLVLSWLADLRAKGVRLPVSIGVPGPADGRRLLKYASRYGVRVSPQVASQYGFSQADPAATAGPERFLQTLACGYDPQLHGDVRLHFYPFGGITALAQWLARFRAH
jgi:methylenetetrahydrofolate reductase (NADPH)